MAKLPVPGQVNTRLAAGGAFTNDQAAQIATAMLGCTAVRLSTVFDHPVLAITPDDTVDAFKRIPGCAGLRSSPQGEGDLGERIDRIWTHVAADRPTAFFGTDSPDVPADLLQAVKRALDETDLTLGPTPDGGVWVLGGRRHTSGLLEGIRWGSETVYADLVASARRVGASVRVLPRWDDVDRPADVIQLQVRLARLPEEASLPKIDRPLLRLAEQLSAIGSPRPVP